MAVNGDEDWRAAGQIEANGCWDSMKESNYKKQLT